MRLKVDHAFLIFAVALAFSASAQDRLVTNGSFFSWSSPMLNQNRGAGFFDGNSDDGAFCAIGYWLTGFQPSTAHPCNFWGVAPTTVSPFSPTLGPLMFLANGSYRTPAQFTFTNQCSASQSVAVNLAVAGNNGVFAPANTFGLYDTSTHQPISTPLTSGSVGKATKFTPSASFGFYLTNGLSGQTWYSGDNPNFVLFAENPASPSGSPILLTQFLVGAEDRPIDPSTGPLLPTGTGTCTGGLDSGQAGCLSNGTDADYNDIVATVTVQPCNFRGCTLTQGGYKNHFNNLVLDGVVVLGTRSYTKDEINAIFALPVKGNGLISLAHQLITAELNSFWIGGDAIHGSPVESTIIAANNLIGSLVVPPIGSGSLKPAVTSALESILDQYNNGQLGAPHCNE